jgi:hypothetical protein
MWGRLQACAGLQLRRTVTVLCEAQQDRTGDFRPDRTQLSVGRLTDPDDAVMYWLSLPVEEALRARVLEVAQLEER